MTNRIYFSYSRRDQAFAQRLSQDLQKGGFDVWIDIEQIAPGQSQGSVGSKALDDPFLL
jgi:hypothetical protein